MNVEYVNVVSLSWDEALISFALGEMSSVEVVSLDSTVECEARSEELVDIGRIKLTSLTPDTDYRVLFKWNGGERALTFKTLERPTGELHSSFAVVADPHVSLKPENRKGRLFVESASILRDVVDDINSKNVDFVLMAGDLTNKGTQGEYEVASSVLERLEPPLLAVPGDHDINPSEGVDLWTKYFGERQWERRLAGYGIVGLDSSDNHMDAKGAEMINRALEDEDAFPLIVSHLQLVDVPRINIGIKQKTVSAVKHVVETIDALRKRKALFYAGHQNVPARVAVGDSLQMNVPQTNQYVCAYYWIRRYENGFYHTLVPIASEVLRQYSRRASNIAADLYDEPQWRESYREGGALVDSNFLVV